MATNPIQQLVQSFLSIRARVHARRSDAWLERRRRRDYAVWPYYDQPDQVSAVQEARDMGRQFALAQEATDRFASDSSSSAAGEASSSSEEDEDARRSNSDDEVYSDNDSVTEDNAAAPAMRWT